jgi:hypothetical protein
MHAVLGMSDLTRRLVGCLDQTFGTGSTWDVLPGLFSTSHDVCHEYRSAGLAYRALCLAGFLPSARLTSLPPVAQSHRYDPQTMMRFSLGGVADVVMVRRTGVVTPPYADGQLGLS